MISLFAMRLSNLLALVKIIWSDKLQKREERKEIV